MKPPHSGRPGGPPGGGPRRPGGQGPGGKRPGGPGPHGGGQRDERRPAGVSTPGGERRLSIGAPGQPNERRPGTGAGPRAPKPEGERKQGRSPGGGSGFREHRGGSRPDHAGGGRPGIETPRGGVWLYGQHAVGAALANPARRLRRLLATEEAEFALKTRLPAPWPVPAERVERGRIDGLLGRDTVHQGLALLADPLATPTLAQALERPGPVLVLDQVTDPRNVGALLRSAAAFGCAAVIVQDRNAPEETGALAKAASGALESVPLLRAVNIARTLIALKASNVWTIGLDASGPRPLSGPALAGRRSALVLGAEGEGLRRLTRETCDELCRLDMPGSMESLNVSAAGTVGLYELVRAEVAKA